MSRQRKRSFDWLSNEGVTEQLKVSNQMAWIRAMNNIRSKITEITNAELIFIYNKISGSCSFKETVTNLMGRYIIYTDTIKQHEIR